MSSTSIDILLQEYVRENKHRYGIISLNHFLFQAPLEDLERFCQMYRIPDSEIPPQSSHPSSESIVNREKLINSVLSTFLRKFRSEEDQRKKYQDPICYLGDEIYNYIKNSNHDLIYDYDFIAKTDLIEKFADYCADLGINTYDARKLEPSDFDLYLIKKTQGVFVTTESVVVRTYNEVRREKYENLLAHIARATQVAEWKLFVTTPAAAMYLGLDRLIADMKRLNTWLYIVDPVQKRVFGITKGKKNKARDIELRDRFVQRLPQTPIRAPSQVLSISKYRFEEKYAYKPKNIRNFILHSRDAPEHQEERNEGVPKYHELVQTLLIMDKNTGLTLYTLENSQNRFDSQMISGFLSAVGSFAQEFGAGKGGEEINYKGFTIITHTGDKVKALLILSNSADSALNERLREFTQIIEERYMDKITIFIEKGQNVLQEDPQIKKIAERFLNF